jgi:hypothetical protein
MRSPQTLANSPLVLIVARPSPRLHFPTFVHKYPPEKPRKCLLHRTRNLVPFGIHALLISNVVPTLCLPGIPLTGAGP